MPRIAAYKQATLRVALGSNRRRESCLGRFGLAWGRPAPRRRHVHINENDATAATAAQITMNARAAMRLRLAERASSRRSVSLSMRAQFLISQQKSSWCRCGVECELTMLERDSTSRGPGGSLVCDGSVR